MKQGQMPGEDDRTPLVLDVDGTLLRTDLLFETFWIALGTSFWLTLKTIWVSWGNPARLKHELFQIAQPDVELAPVNQQVLDHANRARAEGRPVHLASGSHQALVNAVAERFGFDGEAFGSSAEANLTGETKANLLRDRFGEGGYDYAGNDRKDWPSWRGARHAIAVTNDTSLKSDLSRLAPNAEIMEGAPFHARILLKELRPHQWVKNLLLFFPLLVMHVADPLAYLWVTLTAIAFGFGASSIYILNDLLDLPSDRIHPEKRARPIASGALSIPHAMVASAALAVTAPVMVWMISSAGAVLTLAYMASSLGYSLWLKKRRWLDVLALATLFTLRVVTGAVVVQVAVPGPLMVFVFFAFFTLACIKRMTALTRLATRDHLPGRGYSARDLRDFLWVSRGSILVALGAFWVYAISEHASLLYTHQAVLALAAVPFAVWLFRLVRLSEKGLEDYDPIVFVFKDRIGLALVASSFAIATLAA